MIYGPRGPLSNCYVSIKKYMKSTWGIGLVFLISVIHYSIIGWYGDDPSRESAVLMSLSLYFMFAWWAIEDAKSKNIPPPNRFWSTYIFCMANYIASIPY